MDEWFPKFFRKFYFMSTRKWVVSLLSVVELLPSQIYREARHTCPGGQCQGEREEKQLNLCELRALRGSKTNHTIGGDYQEMNFLDMAVLYCTLQRP